MEAKELRIGNFVIDSGDGNIYQIPSGKSIYASHLMNPIDITEEWLLKFGFESNQVSYKIDNGKFIFELYFYDAWNLNYVEKPKFGNGSVEISGYWKIHELQNLYFALTGEELELKN